MKASDLCVVANLDLGVWQFSELLYCLHISGAHVGSGDDAEFAAVLGKFLELVHQKPQPAPLDERNQHINAVSGSDFFLELGI